MEVKRSRKKVVLQKLDREAHAAEGSYKKNGITESNQNALQGMAPKRPSKRPSKKRPIEGHYLGKASRDITEGRCHRIGTTLIQKKDTQVVLKT